MRRTEKGLACGAITAEHYQVFAVLLYQFHNSNGKVFPVLQTAPNMSAACDTIAEAVKALEACGLLAWVNYLTRKIHGRLAGVVQTSDLT